MLRTELSDLVSRGFRVEMEGSFGHWSCLIEDPKGGGKFRGASKTPEDALAAALDCMGFLMPFGTDGEIHTTQPPTKG